MTHVYHVWIRKLGKRWIFIFHIAFQYFQSMYWQEGTCEKELMITFWRSSMVSSQTLVSSYSMSCSLSSFFAAGFLMKPISLFWCWVHSSTSEAICQRILLQTTSFVEGFEGSLILLPRSCLNLSLRFFFFVSVLPLDDLSRVAPSRWWCTARRRPRHFAVSLVRSLHLACTLHLHLHLARCQASSRFSVLEK